MSRGKITLKSQHQIDLMRAAGKLVAETHAMISEYVRPGVTTGELDQITETYIRLHGGIPSFKGFLGFPASICVAVNDQVVHGIPGNQVLRDGDVIALDIGIILNGWHGDSCWTYPVGTIDSESQRLMDVCHDSLFVGIEKARSGNRLTDISHAIEQHVNQHGFSVVRNLFGHGIGRNMHEAPSLPHYGPAGDGPVLKPGMVFTIEPMIVAGSPDVRTLQDGWTIITADGSRSAQYEHTIAITNNGPAILTLP